MRNGTLDDLLRESFRLAHRRLGFVFLDLIWKAIWFALTAAALILLAVWFGSETQSVIWPDTGNRSGNTAVAFALLRQFWSLYRAQVFGAVATVLIASLTIWFVLEAIFRARWIPLPLGEGGAPWARRVRVSGLGESGNPYLTLSQRERVNPGFSTFLLSNFVKCFFLASAALAFAAIAFARYFATPFAEWYQLWPDTRGAAVILIVMLAALEFLLTIIETVVRGNAVDLLGTDLFRVAGLIGILLLFEATISGSCAVILGVGFLNISGWRDALLMLGTAAVIIVFMTVVHSYLLLVRFSAVGIMRQNVVEL